MEKLNVKDIKNIFNSIKEIMINNEEYLFGLDSAMGDGDLGLTMKNGFIKVNMVLENYNDSDIGDLFLKAGLTMASSVPSTMGTLIATGFIRAAKVAKGKTDLELKDVSDLFSAFISGIMERGNSKPGDRTIIDSILPASIALKKAVSENMDFQKAFELAIKSAEDGLESTKRMAPVHGKSLYHVDKSNKIEDPGAAAGVLMLKGLYRGIAVKKQ